MEENLNTNEMLSENVSPETASPEAIAIKAANSAILSPRNLAVCAAEILYAKKAFALKLLHVEEQTILADYFLIANGNSNTQLKALADELIFQLNELGIQPSHIEGMNEATWIILDYGSVIIHLFNPETRRFYNLERLWSESEEVDITPILTDDKTPQTP